MKLEIGSPNNNFKKEADNVANKVMSIPAPDNAIQRKCSSCEQEELQMKSLPGNKIQMQPIEEEEELLQPKLRLQPTEEEELMQSKLRLQPFEKEEELLQPKKEKKHTGNLDAISENMDRSNGSSLSDGTNQFMSNAFGNDFSRVKIHTGSRSIQMNQQLGARAFTFGNDIYFNRGEYKPSVSEGKKLLAHELTHVVQQTKPIIQRAKRPVGTSVANLETYGAGTRQNIRYDSGFKLQKGIKAFFKKGIVMSVRTGCNVDFVVKGFTAKESWVENALKALALYTFKFDSIAKEKPITNITTVQHLDLSGKSNPCSCRIK